MTVIKAERTAEADQAAAAATAAVEEVEGEIRAFVRRDLSVFRRRQPENGEAAVENVNSVIERVSGASVVEIERVMAAFVQVKGELEGLKIRLAPLDDKHSGVNSLVNALHDVRDRLTSTIERLDRDGDVTLAERAAKFAESKQAFDERVAGLLEQFSRLEGINKDIRGLFAKLRGEVDAQLATYEHVPK